VDERDVLNAWRNLFRGNQATPDILAKAEELLSGLSGESPLHLRLAGELNELKKGPPAAKKRKLARRSPT
jgi:hypothetical protein